MTTITKTQLVDAISADTGLPKTSVNKVLGSFTDQVKKLLTSGAPGDSIAIDPALGRFKLIERAARKARNPATGAEIDVPAKRALTFRPSKGL